MLLIGFTRGKNCVFSSQRQKSIFVNYCFEAIFSKTCFLFYPGQFLRTELHLISKISVILDFGPQPAKSDFDYNMNSVFYNKGVVKIFYYYFPPRWTENACQINFINEKMFIIEFCAVPYKLKSLKKP